jgi:drug/metabolite transporter, DME family
MPRHSGRGALLILVAALFWSTGGLFIKSISLDGYGISFWRSSLAAITLFIAYLIFVPKQTRHASRWTHPDTIITALVYAALLILFVLATKLTTSANAIFLQFTAPIYVLVAEPIVSRTKIKGADIAAVMITIGAMVLFFVGKFEGGAVLGNILALVSGVCFAAYTVLLKHARFGEEGRWHSVIMGHVLICIAMAVIAVVGITDIRPRDMNDVGMLAFLGVLQIGIPYTFFTIGIRDVKALDALLLSMLEPVLNPIWVFIGIGEQPSKWAIVGGSIIIAVVIVRSYLAIGRRPKEIIPDH